MLAALRASNYDPHDCIATYLTIGDDGNYGLYSDPCILRPLLQPQKFGLKWEMVLKWKDIYVEIIRIVSLIAGLTMEGTVKWRGLKS